MDRAQIRMAFLGRWFDAGIAPPNTSPAERRELAEWMRRHCARPTLYPDPLHFVVRLGLRPVEQRMPGSCCEYTDGHTIMYPPSLDQRETGGRIYHAIAHCLLVRYFLFATETDAVLLGGELALPTAEARKIRSLEESFVLQRWAPEWLLLFQLAAVKLQRKAA